MNTARTPLFYMANLGSEVARLSSALENGVADAQASLARCLHILDEYERIEPSTGGKKEAETLRRVLVDFVRQEREYSVSAKQLEEYFMPFALRFQRS
jgi:hypothetical protein